MSISNAFTAQVYQENDKTDVNKPGQIVIIATKDETTVRWKLPAHVKAKTEKKQPIVK